jgi:hypothetical protein
LSRSLQGSKHKETGKLDTFIKELTQEKKMKKYEVTFQTTATVVVEVDAQDSDTALEYAWDYLDQNDAEFGEWECINVDRA